VRVNTDTLDRFLSTVGEVILNSNQLRTSAGASAASKTAGMAGGLDRMDRVVGELQRRALELRTTPLLRIVEPLPRVAREVAQLGGKRVEVEIQGAELDLDRSILDRLSDPLVHLVRNAVDHGIETPEVRAAAGKPEVGCVTIDARRVKDSIRIAVRDDGEGIDLEAVRARAVERGLVVLDLAEDLSPEDVASFVFHPGLSTAEPPSPGWVRPRPSWCRLPQRCSGCCWWRPPARRWRFRFAGWSASSSFPPTRSSAAAPKRSP
jgi:two-component system chemotaxis sensor kinase CheA